ncbi:MAG: hypothetical protein ACSHWU_10150, partial [Marinicella sp.]
SMTAQAADLRQDNELQLLTGDDVIFLGDFEDFCIDVDTPPGISAANFNYVLDLNDGLEFGVSTNTDVLINLFNTHYAVASNFTYPDTPNFRRRLDFVSAPTSHNKAHLSTVSISLCPGDFSETAVCSKVVESFRSMSFSSDTNDNPSLYCILEPGKTYYMNVINSSSPYTITPSCDDMSDSNCALFFTETSL